MTLVSRALAMVTLAAGLLAGGSVMAQYTGGPDSTGLRDRTGGNGVTMHDAVGAAILSDVAAQRQAEREARRQPYGSPSGYASSGGIIRTTKGARLACGREAAGELGPGGRVAGIPAVRTMASGWEVAGDVRIGKAGALVPFICSVREGAVTGVVLQR